MRALVTGASGFVAGHLALELRGAGWDVCGVSIDIAENGGEGSAFTELLRADVTSPSEVSAALNIIRPDAIFHLAGMSSVSAAERDPGGAFQSNCMGALVLLQEVKDFRSRTGITPTTVVVGSAEQYGRHDMSSMPLPESAELRPQSSYAASKCAQEVVALQMFRTHAIPVICARSFNHSGAGQRTDFLIPSLVRRALGVKLSGAGALPVGNMSPVRDYLHVEDVCRAYRLLLESGRPGEVYNVSSGVGRSVADILETVLRLTGVKANAVVSPELVRTVDIPVLTGSNEKLASHTGWRQQKTFEQIIEDLVIAAS